MDIYDFKPVQAFADFRNFIRFKRQIKNEIKKRDSKFNKFGLKKNWLGDIIYTQINCTDVDFMNANYDEKFMLDIKLKPIVEYLSNELNWGDYLVPQVSNFIDEEGEPSLSFGVLFIFTGYALTRTNFMITILILLALAIGAIILI